MSRMPALTLRRIVQ